MIEISMNEIYNSLNGVIHGKNRVIVIHSSLPQLGSLSKNFKWQFMSALRKLISEGHTVVLPTFTFSFCDKGYYHYIGSNSETGILGDWFLKLSDVKRTNSPIYSFAVSGPYSEEIIKYNDKNVFGSRSPFSFFHKLNAQFIMLGCGWKYCTQFHYYEELKQVPYRHYKEFIGRADFGNGLNNCKCRMFVRNLEVNPINFFDNIVDSLKVDGLVSRSKLGDGIVESVSCKDLSKKCIESLNSNIFSLVESPNIVESMLNNIYEKQSSHSIKVAILSNNNVELLLSELKKNFSEIIPNREVLAYTVSFGTLYQSIVDVDSDLYKFDADFTFFSERLEDVFQTDLLQDISKDKFKLLDLYITMIETYIENNSGQTYVNTFEQITQSVYGNIDKSQKGGVTNLLNISNKKLERCLFDKENCALFNLRSITTQFNGKVFDSRLWFLGKYQFSDEFSTYLIKRYISIIVSHLGYSTRLILVDLDNTLWGGVLGEDGLDGIKLGGDFPGNAFLNFQKTLKGLKNRGIAIGILSKNSENDALRAIENLPNMAITKEDITIFSINWNKKWENLLEISKKIGLGVNNILFIDDNPVEREQMRINLPGVKILDLPDDPSLYSEVLLNSPYIELTKITKEDLNRNKSYSAKFKIDKKRENFSKIEDFYSNLKPKLVISKLLPSNISRAVQLIAKTNQFNTTTIRYKQSELSSLHDDGKVVYVLGYKDVYSDFENVGLAIIDWKKGRYSSSNLDLFLLSCRVLERGIELGFLGWWHEKAKVLNRDIITGDVVQNSKNKPAHSLFLNSGFVKIKNSESKWKLRIDSSTIKIPKWISIDDKT